METQLASSLQEAYINVYEENNETSVEKSKRRNSSSGMSSRDRLLRHRLQRGMKKGQDGREAAERQYEEQVDLYNIILSHLLDEGYVETPEAAEVVMVNMSEEWRENIVEGYKRFPYKRVEDRIHKKEGDNPTGRGTPQSVKMDKVFRHFKGGKEVRRTEKREHSPKISKAKEEENRRRGREKEA